MSAITAERLLDIDNPTQKIMLPVANGQIIYGGTAGIIAKEGLLENLTTANINEGRMVVWISDKTANTDNTPTATTSAGSISGTLKASSAVAGDKTVRECYTGGHVWATFTAISQNDVGKTVYIQNNNTCDETQVAGIRVGTLDTYISATSGRIALNQFFQMDGTVMSRGAIIAGTTTTGGDCINWENPTGETILVEDIILDITTPASGAATADIGIAATGTTSDVLIDGVNIGAAAIVASAITDGGSNGQANRKCTSAQYVTMTPSATSAGLVGTFGIKYRIWE